MKLSEKMTAKAGRIRGHYLGTTRSSELLLEYAPEVAKLEEGIEALKLGLKAIAGVDGYEIDCGHTAKDVANALLKGAPDA